MISISEKSRIAVEALMELGGRNSGEPVPILEIAERRAVAVHVLEQIFSSLRRAGILQSQRGVHGGYSLRRPATTLTVFEVVVAIDGPLDASAIGIWGEARDALAAVLTGQTIASLLERERQSAPMFHI